MGAEFADVVFVGGHGSTNRDPPGGYEFVFVPFRNGEPAGDPVDFVSGFRGDDGMTRGRPVGVTVDPRGALIVADDLSNTIWRVTPTTPVPVPAAALPGATPGVDATPDADRSEEHTSELQSLMRTSYAVYRLQKKHTSNVSNHEISTT